MKTILALHGNPGHLEDWSVLKKILPQSYELVTVDPHDENWTSLLAKTSGKKILLGHSWGCYRILKALRPYASSIEKAILVAPYVQPERPLSALAQALLKVPILGDALIKSSHAKSKDSFFAELIHPLKSPPARSRRPVEIT